MGSIYFAVINLTIFLSTYDINKKYLTYMLMISRRCYYLKLISAFHDIVHHDIFYY